MTVTILLEEDVRLDPRDFADTFMKALGVTRPESRMLLRRARGIVLEKAAPDVARTIVDALAAKGVRARAVPHAELPKLPPVMRATTLERGDGLLLYGSGALAWSDILVAVCAPVGVDVYNQSIADFRMPDMPLKTIDDPEMRDLLRENSILGVQGARAGASRAESFEDRSPSLLDLIEKSYAEKLKLYLDLVTRDRSRWIRVTMSESSYKATADGVHMGSALGFQHLFEDLIKHVPEERRTPSIHMMLLPGNKADLLPYVLPDGEELTRYTMWRAYLAAASAPPDEPVETINLEEVPPCPASSSPSPAPAASSTDAASPPSSPPPATTST